MSELRVFHWADYVVFCLMLLVSAAIGVYYGIAGRRHQNTEEFLMGGRDLQVLPVALSVQASFISAIFVLGLPVEVYYFGITYGLVMIGYVFAYPITGEIFVPKLHRLKLTSGYEYLERRFSKVIRTVASLTFIIMTILYMSVVLYAPALAFSQVTGMSMLVTIVGIGLVCTFYTSLGGMKAVVWTDTVQMLVIFGGLLALVIQGSIDSGGLSSAVRLSAREGRLNFFNFSLLPTERTTFWTQSIGGCFLTLTLHASNQTLIQRYLSIKRRNDAKKAVYLGLLGSIVYLVLVLLVGVVMYAYYHGCDPLLTKQIRKADQMVPLFMMDVLGQYPGLPGLFTACTFSAALSSVSSGVNALAAVLLEDIIKPLHLKLHRQPLTERAATNASRGMAVVFGVLTIVLGYLAQYLGETIIQLTLSIMGMAGGPLLGLFVLAMFFPCVNSWGALAGVAVSFLMSFWVGIGAVLSPGPKPFLPLSKDLCNISVSISNASMVYDVIDVSPTVIMETSTRMAETEQQWSSVQPLYNLSYMWYSVFAVLMATAVGVPVSLMTGGTKAKLPDPSLMFIFSRHCCSRSNNKVDDDAPTKTIDQAEPFGNVDYKNVNSSKDTSTV